MFCGCSSKSRLYRLKVCPGKGGGGGGSSSSLSSSDFNVFAAKTTDDDDDDAKESYGGDEEKQEQKFFDVHALKHFCALGVFLPVYSTSRTRCSRTPGIPPRILQTRKI